MNEPRISILTPVYNAEKYIAETFDSIRRQTYSDWEVILMDGGSKDRTLEIANHYAKEDPRIRVFSEPDEGPYDAFHKALSKARGEFISMVCASDGLLEKRWLELCAKAFDADKEISLVWGIPFDADESGKPIGPHFAFAHFLKESKTRSIFFRELIARASRPRTLLSSLKKLNRAHIRAAAGVLKLERPPQKKEWFSYWLQTGTVFPDGNMCVAKNVFKEVLAPYARGTREAGDWMSFYFDFNAKGYLPWCIPIPANFARRAHGPSQVTAKVQEYNDEKRRIYFERIAILRKEISEGTKTLEFRDRAGNVIRS